MQIKKYLYALLVVTGCAHAAPQSLSVLTYNVWMLPYQMLGSAAQHFAEVFKIDPSKISLTQLQTDAKKRAKEIPTQIISRADVFALQELFDDCATKIFKDEMKKRGAPYRATLKRSIFSSLRLTHSGLMVVSKYPIVESDGIYFQDSFGKKKGIKALGEDRLADKGVLYAKIEKKGRMFHVFTTHLQADLKSIEAQIIREAQLERLFDFIASKKIADTEPVIILGDFNISIFKRAWYLKMLEVLQAHEVELTGYPFTEDNDQLDYILLSNNHLQAGGQEISQALEEIKLSDHLPVVATLTFE